ncbi:DUF1643 domain-containing protein [Myxosarcina sp. GI1]|uniref:DUF1643 domain-containing protein n=1 Tax=Myxosarcina sp. GI1 TaxID=1541065 RepID=UPI0005677E81|nr:DUF1643 domain-containing protein [Myxosarcina sp. GI1]
MHNGAVIIGNYRYVLWREWNSNSKTVSFIMLNPSRADEKVNDPTITRCINFAKSWDYGKLEVVNLFAYRTSQPSQLKQTAAPIGKDNDKYILETVSRSDKVVLAWGNHGIWQRQDLYVLNLLKNYTHLYCLGITKQNCPRHPLYLHRTTMPQVFNSLYKIKAKHPIQKANTARR